MRPDRARLVLVGMMGAGKSTVGRALAARLGWSYVDNDELVRAITGVEPDALAAARGVEALHEVEIAAAQAALDRPGPLVASLAGFVVTDPEVARLLRARAVVAWLRARPTTLRTRVGEGAGRRAEASSLTWLEATAAAREPDFATVADHVVDVDDRDVASIVDELVARLGPIAPEGSRATRR
jgi:shikimate kinase